jgi:hypothetical protein
MVHLKNPVSIKNTLALFAKSIGCLQRTAKKQNKLPRSKKHGIGMGIKYFRHQEQGIKPQEIIKQNRMVDKQSASSISTENNLKPTNVLRNQDTNSSCCIVRTSTI